MNMQVQTTNEGKFELQIQSKKTPLTPSREIPKAVKEKLYPLLDSKPGRSMH